MTVSSTDACAVESHVDIAVELSRERCCIALTARCEVVCRHRKFGSLSDVCCVVTVLLLGHASSYHSQPNRICQELLYNGH